MIRKVISFILLICLLPLFLIVALLIIIEDGFPVFYRQRRVGLKNNNFLIYKFRTMRKDTPDIPTHLVQEPQNNFTFIGPTIRKFSIDELPQLINIIKGEMNFIGPRPALYNQKDLIDLRKKAGIHNLIPGITGWAQVNGRDDLPIHKKVELDKYYFQHKSFFLDIKILLKTTFQIIFPKGVSH